MSGIAGNKYRYVEINLDSGDYTLGSKDRPTFVFNDEIDDSNYFQVHRVTLPTTYYVFDEDRVSMNIDGSPVTWPQGNYTPSEWGSLIATATSNAVTVSYSNSTNKLTFTSNAPFTIGFTTSMLANDILGFDNNVTVSSTLVSGNHVIVSPYVVNFSGPNFVYLRSSMASVFNNVEVYFTNTVKTNTGGDIMAMIPITQNRNSLVEYIDQSGQFFQWNSKGNREMSFYFTLGRRIRPLAFNGETFQLRLHGYSLKEEGPYRFNT